MLIEQKEVELSYSQNLLHSLNTGAKVSVTVNNNSVGVLDTHHRSFKKDELVVLCGTSPAGEFSLTSKCVMKVVIHGDSSHPVPMEVTGYYLDSPIPLMDGVVLSYTSQQLQPKNPALFYYPLFNNQRPHLLVRSTTYHSYKVVYKWVNLTEYSTAPNPKDLYPHSPRHINSVTSFKISAYFRVIDIQTTQP